GDALTYVWERNGAVVVSGPDPSWVLPGIRDDDTEVRVTVRDPGGLSTQAHTWHLAVTSPPKDEIAAKEIAPNRPPRITGLTPDPARPLPLEEGASADLSVRAEDPDADDRLSYHWYVDGQNVPQHASTWHFKAPGSSTEHSAHKVEVEAADRAGLKSARMAWNVDVTWAPPTIVEAQPRG